MGQPDDPGRGRHRAQSSLTRVRGLGARRSVVLALVAVALLAVAAVGVFVVRTSAASRDDRSTGQDLGAARDLAAWAAGQLPSGATLSAEPDVRAELTRAGVPAGMLTEPAGAAGPALRVVRGPAPGGPAVVARFAGGGEGLTVVDPAAALPDQAQLDRRRELGAALLANPMTATPAGVAQRLRDGQVDPRLLTLLAGLAARSGIALGDLPPVAGEPIDAPTRAAVVTAVGGRPVVDGSTELAELRSYLAAQLPTFSPDETTVVEGGLLLRFRYVTDPDGALTAGGG